MKKIMLDIDGVLNSYPLTFIKYCNEVYHKNFNTLEEIKETFNSLEFRKIKDEYKFSEYKHLARVKEGTKELISYLKLKNYLIYIVTSRDLFEKNQLELTINWLKINGIHYDFLYQAEHKELAVLEKFHHFDIIVEDNFDNLEKLQAVNGFNCKYFYVCNESYKTSNFYYIKNLKEIIEYMEEK